MPPTPPHLPGVVAHPRLALPSGGDFANNLAAAAPLLRAKVRRDLLAAGLRASRKQTRHSGGFALGAAFLGVTFGRLGDWGSAEEAAAGDVPGRHGQALVDLAELALSAGDRGRALRYVEEAVGIALESPRKIGPEDRTRVLASAAAALVAAGEATRAGTVVDELIRVAREKHDNPASALAYRGSDLVQGERWAAGLDRVAQTLFDAAVQAADAAGDPALQAVAAANPALAAARAGRFEQARAAFQRLGSEAAAAGSASPRSAFLAQQLGRAAVLAAGHGRDAPASA